MSVQQHHHCRCGKSKRAHCQKDRAAQILQHHAGQHGSYRNEPLRSDAYYARHLAEHVPVYNAHHGSVDRNVYIYDEYAHQVRSHMKFEEKTVFPYVESLLEGELRDNYDIDTFSKHHGQTDSKLKELKNIVIKYLPSDGLHNNQLSATLYDIYNNEDWLHQHVLVEDEIFIPAIRRLENRLRQNDVSMKISSMINAESAGQETLSDREKDVVVGVVQGMTNKEIADHMCIALNTVITHRRNIARKLQIRSAAGLTIYAIVNKLVDISEVVR